MVSRVFGGLDVSFMVEIRSWMQVSVIISLTIGQI